jgi:RNA polymerase sigma factor (sigma-70 family)
MRAVRDADAARDLVQETFIKVWQRCASFRGESDVLPWIRSILRHNLLDRLRQVRREVPLEEGMDADGDLSRHVESLSAQRVTLADQGVRQEQLASSFVRGWDSFMSVAPEHALVISWIVEDGLSNEQIAALLGRTPGATREFISQCRKRARSHLQEWYALMHEED